MQNYCIIYLLIKINWSSKLALKAFTADDNKVVSDGGGKTNKTIMNSSKNKKFKKSTCVLNIKAMGEPNSLILNIKKAFNYLQLVFIEALIF